MEKNQSAKCRGHLRCDRAPYIDDLCKFHLSADHNHALTCDEYNGLLVKEIKEAVQTNGIFAFHWHGFNFPKNHVLFDFGIFDEVKDRLANGWFNIEGSNIQNIRVGMYKIHQLIISEAVVHGETMIPVIEIERINFGNSIFRAKFHCASKTSEFDARGAVFDGDFSFASAVSELANFTGCRFNQACVFHGTTGSVFGTDGIDRFKAVGFDGAIFGNPLQTTFQDVDLRKASFKSASLVGVRFYNTNFFQPYLNRNGLYKEVKELQRNKNECCRIKIGKKTDDKNIKRYRHLIHEYRQLRMAMEAGKDFSKAHDFYIGEMKARQRRKWSFILSLYRLSSYYGTKYGRAFGVLFSLFLIHFFLTVIISTDVELLQLVFKSDTAAWGKVGDVVLHSLATGSLQRVDLLGQSSFWQQLVDVAFRLLIPAQAAMFVLALRNMTKR